MREINDKLYQKKKRKDEKIQAEKDRIKKEEDDKKEAAEAERIAAEAEDPQRIKI